MVKVYDLIYGELYWIILFSKMNNGIPTFGFVFIVIEMIILVLINSDKSYKQFVSSSEAD